MEMAVSMVELRRRKQQGAPSSSAAAKTPLTV